MHNPFLQGNSPKMMDPLKAMSKFKMPNFDMKELMDVQRKNIEIATSVNQALFKNLQAFTQSHTELMHHCFEKTASIMKSAMSAETSQEEPRPK